MIVRASDPKTDQANPSTGEPGLPFLPQEDLNFLVKLGVGSDGGRSGDKVRKCHFPRDNKTKHFPLALFYDISSDDCRRCALIFPKPCSRFQRLTFSVPK
ncbi:hypothetical protein HAX54_052424 [Datura stramonium]|uniref:Uncharacterized protein n=1 Tax=Datura stramonium TaxID=4076 RepID=A0ABS8RRW5_DATST|nr:hypothetical protein [Datura stramonium]